MTKVFLSYSRTNKPTAQKLVESLGQMKFDVWVDWEDIQPASDWMDRIKKGIEEADAFLFLLIPDSITSEYCNFEVGQASRNNKRIIPVVVKVRWIRKQCRSTRSSGN